MPRSAPARLVLAWILLSVLGAGCRSTAAPAPEAASPAAEPETDYVFCFLVSGTARAGITPERAQELQRGHMANISRLAAERTLLVAGPFAEPRLDPRLRGVFVFDVASVPDARALVATDPAVEAGTLAAELHPFRSRARLRALPELYEANERERRAADPNAPPFEGRRYVLVQAADGAAAARALTPLIEDGRVLFHGRLGGELAGNLLACLDETELEAARARLEAAAARAEVELDWQLMPWFASHMLLKLPALAAATPEPGPRAPRLEVGGSIQVGLEQRR